MGNVLVDSVTKRYDNVTAVNDMNLDIEDGEFVCLVGPSGCGKSTTLETIAGLTIPTEGTIEIAGKDVTTLPPKDRGIAMVFQNIALFPHMDVYDNISFGLQLRNFDQEEIDRQVENAAEILQIESLLDRKPSELSGGQRQRVAIGRAIVRDPEAFLMDEPLANLDAKLRVHMRTELQRLHKELETTIIYVTHDQAEAMTMSDRIAVLNEGQLQQIDPPLTCYNEPANEFVAGFIGSPSMNFVEAEFTGNELVASDFSVEFNPSQVEGLGVGDQVTIGVRPEDVYLAENSRQVHAPTAPFRMVTDVTEPMGDEIFVYMFYDEPDDSFSGDSDRTLLMSVEPDVDIEQDTDVQIILEREKLHLFDADTGDAIVHGIEDLTEQGTVKSNENRGKEAT